MMKRMQWIILAMALLLVPALASAQEIEFEWNRWDVTITVEPDSNVLTLSEIQEFAVSAGTVRFGTRTWTQPVDVQAVYAVMNDSRTPVQLQPADSEEPGTYVAAPTPEGTDLRYFLPEPAESGETFLVQINYSTNLTVEGLLDWVVIPGEHAAPIEQSTITVNFPPGQAPDVGLVRVTSGSGTVEQNGSSFVIRSEQALAPDEMFAIQAPFGEGVGAAVPGSSDGVQPAPGTKPDSSSGNGGISLPSTWACLIVCGLMVLVLLGGGSLLRGLPFFPTGGSTGGIFPRGTSGSSPTIPTRPVRGFRRSSTQGRRLPRIGNRKGPGGSAGLG